ncbi:MAG: glycoside hydrolase family 3 protein [Clostridia bacterium]
MKKQKTYANLGLKVSIGILTILIIIGCMYLVGTNQEIRQLKEAPNETKNNIVNIVSDDEKIANQNEQEGQNVSQKTNELFEEYYTKAQNMMQTMTLEEKVSQMFIARCPTENQIATIKNYQPGGYILFAKDFEGKTKNQVIKQIQEYQTASKLPMIIGVDEEGGTVVRVSRNQNLVPSQYLSPQALYKQGGLEKIRQDAIEKSQVLLSLGINLNLAPVSDVSTSSLDFIYQRSFGQNATQTAQYVKTVVEAMKSQNIACTLKHFPGYGNNKDSHTAVTYDDRGLETFRSSDFLPFQAGIDSGAQTVLVCHNIVKSMDANTPASLSKKVHEILRNELHFTGLIMTDDLAMDAATEYGSISDVAILAIEAGNDILLTSDFQEQRQAIITAVKDKRITEQRINESVKKIIAYKYAEGLIKS